MKYKKHLVNTLLASVAVLPSLLLGAFYLGTSDDLQLMLSTTKGWLTFYGLRIALFMACIALLTLTQKLVRAQIQPKKLNLIFWIGLITLGIVVLVGIGSFS